VDLHGQHEHQVLLDATTHLDLLDEFAGLAEDRRRVAEAFAAWQRLRDERERLAASQRETAARAEFLQFQLAEIQRAAPRAGRAVSARAARALPGRGPRAGWLRGNYVVRSDRARIPPAPRLPILAS